MTTHKLALIPSPITTTPPTGYTIPKHRRKTRQIKLGKMLIGGDAPISIQSMATEDTRNIQACIDQCRALAAAGCEIVRVAVPDEQAALALGSIRKAINIPLIADIHFEYQLALEAIRQGVDGLRINPGNIGARYKVEEVLKAARERQIPIRIGVNAGSLEKDLFNTYGNATPEALVESAWRHIRILEDHYYPELKVSLKSTDVPTAVRAYRLFAEQCDYPVHLGITEAGTLLSGSVKSALGLGMLLAEGIGDTLRVSLAADPLEEVRVGQMLLRFLGIKAEGLEFVACPTCGRCSHEMIPMAERIEKRLQAMNLKKPLRVAVMGCEVNGPGEARAADVGIALGRTSASFFRHGHVVTKGPLADMEERLIHEVLASATGGGNKDV